MLRLRLLVLAACITIPTVSPIPARAGDGSVARLVAQTRIETFQRDPSAAFAVTGPGSSQFVWDGASRPRFAGDPRGALVVTFDSLEPTSRFAAPLARPFTHEDDFLFGAILTIRPDGFAPDPSGFHPIAFALFNAATTGDDRTGSLGDFRADTFDTVEFSYFPNVSPLFGGPFLAPDVFGEAVGDDAFAHFAFTSIPFTLHPGVPYLVEMDHDAARRVLTARVSMIHPIGVAVPVEGGTVAVDLSRLTGFRVDHVGVAAYHDGFNIFSDSGRSLLATVEFDLIYAGPRVGGRIAPRLAALIDRLKGERRVVPRGAEPGTPSGLRTD